PKHSLEAYSAAAPPAVTSSVPARTQAPVEVPAPPPPPAREPARMPGAAPAIRVEPMSVMRQRIAEHMVMSSHTSVHVTTVHKADVTRVAKLREKLKAQVQAQYGFGLTFLPFVLRAATAAL